MSDNTTIDQPNAPLIEYLGKFLKGMRVDRLGNPAGMLRRSPAPARWSTTAFFAAARYFSKNPYECRHCEGA